MESYNYTSDNLDRRGFIDKKTILEYATQEDIFELVFGFKPEEFQYVTSPFREDTGPGCWFEYTCEGKLLFKDFGSPYKKHWDCFDAVQGHFRIPNFYLVLQFIYDRLIAGKQQDVQIASFIEQRKDKKAVKLIVESREFTNRDIAFWSPYRILKQQLIEDKVFSIKRFYALNTKKGNIAQTCTDLAFAFNDFPDGRKKLYFPDREGHKRFLTTCNRNDIGGINTLISSGKQLVISKAYKDYRVLKNNGKHSIWLQNEGMIPDLDILFSIVRNFKQVIVWFDNDLQGIQSSQKISALINQQFPGKSNPLWLPESLKEENITDPSDLLKQKGQEPLSSFINKFT